MSEQTNIEWTDSTFNPWIGCTKVSPACDHCYAERSTPARTMAIEWGPRGERRRTSTANWNLPRRWNAQAEAFQRQHGRRQRVFCASLADVFDNQVPVQWRSDLLDLIDSTPGLDWLLLTKRIGNVTGMLREVGPRTIQHGAAFEVRTDLPPNVWLGATICNQEEADRDIPKLLAVPARVHFLSIEPMLGPINLLIDQEYGRRPLPKGWRGIDWVICGGESGPEARPMPADWARSLRDQCAAAGVPFLFKQWGEWAPCFEAGRMCLGCGRTKAEVVDENGDCAQCGPTEWDEVEDPDWSPRTLRKVGKKAAGRLLDGITHDGYPS